MIADSIAGQARIPHALRRILEGALELRCERERGAIDAPQLALRVRELEARIEQLLERSPTHRPNQRLLREPIELMAAAQREPKPKVTAMLRLPARASPVEPAAAA